MPVLDAEIQVAGQCEPLDAFTFTLEQPTDYAGRPSSEVRVRPVRFTLTGMAAMLQYFLDWAIDHYMRRSGRIVVYENGQIRWRLTFYDAWCTLHDTSFLPGSRGPSFQVTVELSPAAVEVHGVHSEIHTELWWEKSATTRLNVLTKPAELLPSPSLRAALRQTASPDLSPTPLLSPITGAPQLAKPPKTALNPRKKPPYSPTIAKWYKKGGSIEQLANGDWKYTDWLFNSVIYKGHFPDFNPYKRQQADIPDMQGNCTTDYIAARERAPLGRELDTSTWHHHQNLVTMQEVPDDIHARFTHYGARAIIKAKKPGAKIRKRNA